MNLNFPCQLFRQTDVTARSQIAQPLLGVEGYAFIGHGSADAEAVTE